MYVMEVNWKVYVHTNKVNGKRYVGITSKQKPEHRWNSGRGYSKGSRFRNAINKYGWDSFYHTVIFDNLTEMEAKCIEGDLIREWRTQDKEYGYNMTCGGDGSTGFHPSDLTRKKLSTARRRENLSKETLQRRSDGLKGRRFSDDHRMKIGKANSKSVAMFSLDGEFIARFESMAQVESILGVNHSHISQCCNNKRISAGGYRWKYYIV